MNVVKCGKIPLWSNEDLPRRLSVRTVGVPGSIPKCPLPKYVLERSGLLGAAYHWALSRATLIQFT